VKYLKTYKLFESNGSTESELKDLFEPYINWDLIEDAKDMSLEYLDEGMRLFLEIAYDYKYYIYYMGFSNYENFSEWTTYFLTKDSLYKIKPIDKSKVRYLFRLNGSYNNFEEELVSRIKEAYPNEKIG